MTSAPTLAIVLTQAVALLAIACSAAANTAVRPGSTTSAVPNQTLAPALRPTIAFASDPYPAGAIGYAISWPQCGGPYPDGPFAFGIVGVTDGRALTRNPCFLEEYRWAKRGRFHPSIYMNANYRGSGANFLDLWACRGHASCLAYRYGQLAAHDAYAYAASFDAAAPVWWLDVQIVSDWAVDPVVNADSIRGAADYLTTKGIRVGISSTSYQWATVAGNAQHYRPVWDASATDANVAGAFCRQGKDFGGGHTEQIAYVAGGFEVVRACGGRIDPGLSRSWAPGR